jgi:flagella basal body P-ring formation protein FlgA
MTLSRRFFSVWLIVAGCIGSPELCKADTVVTLHGDSDLRRPVVRLSDLFNGVPVGLDREIAQAPVPGQSAVYDAHVLEKLADKYRLDWHAASLSDHVTLSMTSTRITADDLSAAVVKRIGESGVHGEIEISFDNRNADINLSSDQRPDFVLNNFDFDAASKRFRCEVVAGRGIGSLTMQLTGKASVKRRVPVLAHRLDSGTVISMNDIDWITVPDERVTTTVVTDAEQVVGHELRHVIGDNDVIHTNDVIPARLVTRGSLVTLKVQTPYMQVTSQGRALQDGAVGEVVRVNNTQSNRMVEGSVTGPAEVTVHIGQKFASVK